MEVEVEERQISLSRSFLWVTFTISLRFPDRDPLVSPRRSTLGDRQLAASLMRIYDPSEDGDAFRDFVFLLIYTLQEKFPSNVSDSQSALVRVLKLEQSNG
ncbi:hypothetical protein EYF80_042007 [Liparis tanakae]|uniref:Uncharacterized protein n=1 Tax=Liparis tanakae TaxID=230148 RepID=A0A4Z2G3R0_9TELE|nr:hypothetical protein EYF80_042007 [Liparis tanakae]